ncbi:MAG: MlaD family protein [Planctomycetota bacterium]
MNAQRQFILGIFFVVALSTLAFYTLFLTDFTLFGEPIEMVADFPEAHQLREGDPVLVAGTRFGRVKDIEYRPDAPVESRIRVTMHLDAQLEMLSGYAIAIEESTFLGGRNIDIDPGPAGGPPVELSAGGTFAGSVRRNPIAALEEVGDLISSNSGSVTSFLTNLDQLLKDVRQGDGLVNRLIYDETLAADVSSTATDLRATASDLRGMMANISDIIAAVQAGEGTVGKLLNDPALYDNLLETVGSLQAVAADLEAGKGVLGSLLSEDDPLAAELRSIVSNLAGVTAGLESGEGLLGQLLKNPQLAQQASAILTDFSAASADLRAVAKNLQSTEGTVGLLLNDREMYDEALTALKLLTRSLEDYREAAPVSAFTTAIFGAL